MKTLYRDDTIHDTEYVTLHDARKEIEALETRLKRAEKTLQAIESTALEIIPGYGKTALSDFTTPVSVMYRLRDEVDALREQLQHFCKDENSFRDIAYVLADRIRVHMHVGTAFCKSCDILRTYDHIVAAANIKARNSLELPPTA